MTAYIRPAKPGDEPGIHEAHMRSIREICIKDHGEDEVRGWGNRPLGNRWVDPIRDGHVWVVELQGEIHGHGYVRVQTSDNGNGAEVRAHIFGLYLTPEVGGQGFGAKLMALMLAQAKSSGAKAVTLDSSLTAHEFYRRFGFVDSGPLRYTELGGSRVRSYPMVLSTP